MAKRKPDGKLGKVIKALRTLLDQPAPDRDQVLLKFRNASIMAGGGQGVRTIIGDGYWALLQQILHPQTSAVKPLTA